MLIAYRHSQHFFTQRSWTACVQCACSNREQYEKMPF